RVLLLFGEPVSMCFVGQHFEARFLVQKFAPERVYQAYIVVQVSLDQRMPLIVTAEKFVDEDAFIDKIDSEITATEFSPGVLKLIGRTNDRRDAVRREMLLQQDKFVGRWQIFPINNGNVGRARAAPLLVSCQQGFEQFLRR